MRWSLLLLIACSNAKSSTAIDAPPRDAPRCQEIDAGAFDSDVIVAAIERCSGCCVEGQMQCVTPVLSNDGFVVAVSAAYPGSPTEEQLACVSAAIVGRCLPALTGTNVCAVGA